MDQTRHRLPGSEADPGVAGSPRKVGVYDRARERVRSRGMGTGVIAASVVLALLVLLFLLWAILA